MKGMNIIDSLSNESLYALICDSAGELQETLISLAVLSDVSTRLMEDALSLIDKTSSDAGAEWHGRAEAILENAERVFSRKARISAPPLRDNVVSLPTRPRCPSPLRCDAAEAPTARVSKVVYFELPSMGD
ncbi:hypothetical protein [Halomonas heilongjiangensis]|uniref:hypothetical protein n=1 Tax=Halomonas heilongjiangensis TaxID=1387883 RepID=UPI0011AF1564|nr:hypothetical protein [Halomonas heilongjiangensis]